MDSKTHPLRLLRTMAGLTQSQLANALAVEEQYIRRAEKGLVGHSDVSDIIQHLVKTIQVRHAAEGRISIEQAIHTLRGVLLAESSLADFTGPLKVDEPTYGKSASELVSAYINDWFSIKRFRLRAIVLRDSERLYALENHEYKTFREFREAFCRHIGASTSLYSFCLELGLHPFIVQRYEAQHNLGGPGAGGINFPFSIGQALSAVGLDVGNIVITGGRK